MLDLRSFLDQGLAVIVATGDERLRPEISRGWAPELDEGDEAMTLCVGAAPGSATLANLERGGTMAATFSVPTTYRTVQLKGPILGLEEPTEEQLAHVERHVAAFAAEVAKIGMSPEVAARLREPRLIAVRIEVRERYDQTPGPKAGSRL